MKMKVTIIAIPFLVVLVDLTRAQLSLPEMPGPPYPDRFGNNRWGVKYDPRVHGRGQHGSSSSTAGAWGGEAPQYSPNTRYRGAPPPPPPPQRNKWSSALKPLVSRSRFSKSKNKRNRPSSRPKGLFDPTSDSFYRNPYSSKSIDGYVKNYLNTYNKVSKLPPDSPTHMVNIQNFAKPSNLKRFRPFSRNENRRSLTGVSSTSSSSGSSGSLKDSYLLAARLTDNPVYRTVDPQEGFFGPKISKKKSDFAKTLVNLYNDYKPGAENNASDAVSNFIPAGDNDDYPSSLSSIPPPSRSRQRRPRPYSSGSGPNYIERPFKRPRGPHHHPPPPPPPRSYASGPLSSLDLNDDTPSYTSKGPHSSFSSGPYDTVDYLDSPFMSSSGNPFSSSSGPMTRVSSYISGPPPSSLYSSPSDSFDLSDTSPFSSPFSLGGPPPPPSPYSSPLAYAPPPPPPPYSAPFAPISHPHAQPVSYIPPAYPNLQILTLSDGKHNFKRNKKRLQQHTPMNVIRGLLGRGERRRNRDRDNDDDTYNRAYATYPYISMPAPVPPPQYVYHPLVNTLAGPVDYRAPFYTSGFAHPPPPPPHGHGQLSPLAAGLLNLRDTLMRDRPQTPHQAEPASDNKKEGNPMAGPVTQHVQDWPRIFTAMGTSVDAVAGGIHAVRKEISKMTGQTVAKGIMMSGSAVNEVSRGMAHMITKLSSI